MFFLNTMSSMYFWRYRNYISRLILKFFRIRNNFLISIWTCTWCASLVLGDQVMFFLNTLFSMYFWMYSNYISRLIYLYSQFLLTESSITSQGDSQNPQNHQSSYQNGRSERYAYICCSLWSLGLLPFGHARRPEDRAMLTLRQIVPPQQGVNQPNEVPPQVQTP
jgi:hypothetical protein